MRNNSNVNVGFCKFILLTQGNCKIIQSQIQAQKKPLLAQFHFHFSFHLLSFCRSIQDYKIHMDMEIVIFLESRGETNLEEYSNHMVQYSI